MTHPTLALAALLVLAGSVAMADDEVCHYNFPPYQSSPQCTVDSRVVIFTDPSLPNVLTLREAIAKGPGVLGWVENPIGYAKHGGTMIVRETNCGALDDEGSQGFCEVTATAGSANAESYHQYQSNNPRSTAKVGHRYVTNENGPPLVGPLNVFPWWPKSSVLRIYNVAGLDVLGANAKGDLLIGTDGRLRRVVLGAKGSCGKGLRCLAVEE